MRNLNNFLSDDSGNIAVLFALAIVPLMLGVGAGIDYADAAGRQAQLTGIADAAALSALTPAMLNLGGTAAQQQAAMQAEAQRFFDAQSGAVPGVGTITRTVTVTPIGSTYTVDVSYQSVSNNAFAQVLGMSAIAIGGASEAKATLAANTDFYLLVDTSPSMEVAATPSGMVTLVGNTQAQKDSNGQLGCAFGCHMTETWNGSATSATPDNYSSGPNSITDDSGQKYNAYKVPATGALVLTSTSGDAAGNPYVSSVGNALFPSGFTNTLTIGGQPTVYPIYIPIDNYALSHQLTDPATGATLLLRIDLVNDAVTNLFQTAPSVAAVNHAVYNGAVYTFDKTFHTALALTPVTTGMVIPTISPLVYCTNNNQTCGSNDNDQATTLDGALQQMYNLMPIPGSGGKAPGATPREVLIIVTDGLNDYARPAYAPIDTGSASSSAPVTNPATGNRSWCYSIQSQNDGTNPGISVAVLYLTYNSMWPGSAAYGSWPNGQGSNWYSTQVSPGGPAPPVDPLQAKLTAAAQACASPGLFAEVSAGGDVTAALQALFAKATQQAYLSR